MRQASDLEYSNACNELANGLRTEGVRKWLQRRVWDDTEDSYNTYEEFLASDSHDTTILSTQDCEIASDRDILIVSADNKIKNKHNKSKLNELFKQEEIYEFKTQYFIKGQRSCLMLLKEFPKHFSEMITHMKK